MNTDFQPEAATFPDGSPVTPEAMAIAMASPGAHIRQGDVLLVRKAMPKGAGLLPRERGAVVLAHGEVTGHTHRLAGANVSHYRDGGDEFIAVMDRPEPLVHEEHSAVPMAPRLSATRLLAVVHSSTSPANATAAGPVHEPSSARSCDVKLVMSDCTESIVREMCAAASSSA